MTAAILSHDFQQKSHSMVIEVDEIMKLIPHRYPFLLIDRIEAVQLGEGAVGIKCISLNEWYFQGHFPNHPIVPGVLIVEAMAQTAGALVVKTMQVNHGKMLECDEANLVYFMSIEQAKFRNPVRPGDYLKLKVVKERRRLNMWRFRGEAFVGETLMAEATFTAIIMDKK